MADIEVDIQQEGDPGRVSVERIMFVHFVCQRKPLFMDEDCENGEGVGGSCRTPACYEQQIHPSLSLGCSRQVVVWWSLGRLRGEVLADGLSWLNLMTARKA